MVTLLHFTQTQGAVQLTKSMEWGTLESSEWVAYNHKLLVTRSENKELKKAIAALNMQIS